MTRTEERELAEERGENPREEQYYYDHPEVKEEWVSDCCGVPMTGEMIDYGICPDCKEHCEAVNLYDEED